jgi:hypothetical protein
VDHHAQHRKSRQPRVARRGHAAVVHVRQSRADAAQVARITDVRITERCVVEAAQDVMAEALRSGGARREVDNRNRGIRLYRRKPRLLEGPEGLV